MKKKEIIIILFLLLFALPSVLPLAHHGFFLTDDGEWMIIRLSAFYQALHDGQFPVRFLQRLNLGFGYPVAEFLYPGSFYFASFLHIIRFGFVNSIKIVYGVSLIGSGLFTYWWLSRLFSRFPSFIGALFTIYIPYHLYDVYKRGSMEVFALLWVPFILWQLERKNIFWVSVGISLLLLSHNTMALLFLPVLFIYSLLQKIASIRVLITTFFLGILLASFFIIPAVFELPYTIFSQTPVSNPFSYFSDIQMIGYSVLFVLVMIIVLFLLKRKRINKYKATTIFFFIISLCALFLSTSLSSVLWHLPQARLIQFPFRILSYFVISIAFLAAIIISVFKGKQQWITGIILFSILGCAALPYSKPASYFDNSEGYYYTNDATTTVHDEYMPLWVKQKPLNRSEQQIVVLKTIGKVSSVTQTNKSLSFVVNMKRASQVQVNIVYWPGWHVNLDGKSTTLYVNNPRGIMTVLVPKGEHRLLFSFGEDALRFFADSVSILAFICLLFFVSRFLNKK
ncbi:MAG TPA: hypothetical protein VNW29_07250 [Candidatus Sulfotelmatobacter sp.]|jgi:hypothetical protein|nr:hypothetical protein [Candidatus Sulfotelmatobacter sp.]